MLTHFVKTTFVWAGLLLLAALSVKAADSTNAAPKKTHWAYIKPVRPELPQVKNSKWVRNPIDAFVLARLEKEKLKPSPEADRVTLIRRVSLDLIGLPPTIAEVDAFLADKSKNAYEKLVDRLLASPHYGERWARHWLDLARYADTHGYEKDLARVMWPYRDWVIQAFNRNLHFDEFTIEQVAGDMLPNGTQDQKIASGFHRNTMLNTEGGVDAEQARIETIVDRVNTTGSVWLGSTLACAQCHNHKFDPFTNKEYYQMFAFLNNEDEPFIVVYSDDNLKQQGKLSPKIRRLEAEYNKTTAELTAAQAAWEKEATAEVTRWTVLDAMEFSSSGGATLKKLPDDSLLASGNNPSNDTYTFTVSSDLPRITGLRLEVMKDDSLPGKSFGRETNGNFVLSEIKVKAAAKETPQAAQTVALKTADADFTETGYDVTNLIDGKPGPGWSAFNSQRRTPDRAAFFELKDPIVFKQGSVFTVSLVNNSKIPKANLGRFRLAVTGEDNPAEIPKTPLRIRKILAVAPTERTDKQKTSLNDYFRSISPALKGTRDELAEARQQQTKLYGEGYSTTLVMEERAQPRETHIMVRGNFLNLGDKVEPGVPAILPPLPAGQPANRLTLARWLVSPENPLTARVTINRIWEQYFGRGIVETVEDFGTQGDKPTHPELLDWLATEFIRQNWDMKAMHRLIVTSATYRQSSRTTPELIERDPNNRLFARGPRFRVPAETVRDISLCASGLLSEKIGGPSVFPYQPEGIWTQISSSERWTMSQGKDKYRRGLYTFWRRTSPYPAFMSFDAPSRELICTRRQRTNTPLQALTTLNDPSFVEAAEAVARRTVKESKGNVTQRATYAFRLCLTRPPHKNELKRMVALYEQELLRYKQDATAAEKMATDVLGKPAEKMNYAELAAWTVVANVLLNLDETITKS